MSSLPSESPVLPADMCQWLRDARSGDTDALGRVFETYRPYLLKVADAEEEQLLRRKADGADLVQQTFLEAHRGFLSFRGTTASEVRAWLRQILRHTVANLSRGFHNRKHDVTREIPLANANSLTQPLQQWAAGDPTFRDELPGEEQAAVVERILQHLSEDHRRVIVLRIREQRPLTEVATIMGRSSEAVRKLLSRALKKARQYLERNE